MNKESKKAKKERDVKVSREAKTNPRALYRYFASMNKQKESVPNLEKPDGTMTLSDEEKANVLSEFFKSVYVTEGDSPLPDFKVEVNSKLIFFDISVEQVKLALKALNPTKSQGPDGVHSRIL